MLLVKTRLGLSEIHRIGLFASEPIPKGTVIWKYQPGYDIKISEELLHTLPEPAQKQIHHYGYLHQGNFVLCSDDARYFNHSDTANTQEVESEDGEGWTVASRDIQQGEEITCNYKDFDEETSRKLINIPEDNL
jgi:SET domain-containing protein